MASERVLLDCGTSYTKIMYIDTGEKKIVSTREAMKITREMDVVAATGHNIFGSGAERVNELVALAEGGLAMIEENDFVLLDCGARDVKFVRVENRKVSGMDWNSECGAFSGQVIELLMKYFEIDAGTLKAGEGIIPVVCGVLGMTRMFDLISQGTSHEEAFTAFLRGISHNCETLLGKPGKIYLSGGLCENAAFIGSFSCEVAPLGRFTLLEGLRKIYLQAK